VGALQLRQTRAQTAADAAALGAAYEMLRGSPQSVWVSAGKADAGLNGFTDGVDGVVLRIHQARVAILAAALLLNQRLPRRPAPAS
jgi:hypothetical protein